MKAGGSEKRSGTPKKDLIIKPLQSEPQGKFMVKTTDGLDCDLLGPKTKFIEDNCENQNPNYLRDPRLAMLENENRFLKEELKKQKAKASFYKTKYKSIKLNLEKA